MPGAAMTGEGKDANPGATEGARRVNRERPQGTGRVTAELIGILTVGVTLATLVAGFWVELRNDVRESRQAIRDSHQAIETAKNELRQAVSETRQVIEELRDDMREDHAALNTGIGALQQGLIGVVTEFGDRLEALGNRITVVEVTAGLDGGGRASPDRQ